MGGGTFCYLRLVLPELLPNLDKIIYLDSDTLVFTDLTDMYNLPMNDNYIMGFPDFYLNRIRQLEKSANVYINSGTLLCNLTKIRDDKISDKSLTILFTKYPRLPYADQDIINIEYQPKIGILPLKYGMPLVHDVKEYIKMSGIKLNYTEFKEAQENPKTMHLCQCIPKFYKNPKHIFGRKYDKV